MLVTPSRRTVNFQSITEAKLTGMAHLGAVIHMLFNYFYCVVAVIPIMEKKKKQRLGDSTY